MNQLPRNLARVFQQPAKALAALRFRLRKGEVPLHFWQALLSNWPDETPMKLRWLVAHTLSRLQPDNLIALKHYIPGWLKRHMKAVAETDRRSALAIFDKVIAVYVAAAPDVTKSSIGHTTGGGEAQDRSEVSASKAINSPIGILAEALLHCMPDPTTTKGTMPDGIGERLEVLFGANGDGGGHAACVVARHLPWLDHWFSDWSSRVLRPMFAIEHPLSEAVWHGYAASRGWPTTNTLRIICPSLLELLTGEADWEMDESDRRHLVQKMVLLTKPENGERVLISFRQAREVLIALDDRGRSDALWILGNLGKL